jgi:broad specificity phosphatase PhoE
MEPTLVILARHGESDWNLAGRWQGHSDRPLTERGRNQAEALARRLAETPLDAVYSSDLARARDTAAVVAAAQGLAVEAVAELREVDVGSWSGLTRDEAAERFPDGYRRWLERQGPGWEDGETYEQMGGRVIAALHGIARRHPGGRVLVVSHGGSLRAVLAAAAGVDVATYRSRHPVMPNGELGIVLVGPDGRLSEAPGHALD